jgi:hypothetical protein
MIILINGPFGVGKSTVARLLRGRIAASRIYDPEWAGIALMRLARMTGRGNAVTDFQDLALWRKLTVTGIRLYRLTCRGAVIVPMTFSRHSYLDEIMTGIQISDNDIRTFCLQASPAAINERLIKRGDTTGRVREWIDRRNMECIKSQQDPHFGEPVHTDNHSAHEVTELILERLESTA